ncbi:MAG TPA: SIR2 family protein [Bryobacteraceae bacterium]|nr:SIR2 family protein [Bryobacteraceae bacterium]
MIIFGAGASYDSYSTVLPGGGIGGRQNYPERPPLANELFQDLPVFRDQLSKYPEARPLIPLLQSAPDVESMLGSWQDQADDQSLRQLAAIRYYLRDVIYECELQWTLRTRGALNYGTLLDQIRREAKVSIVTFNYDTLIEKALADLRVPIKSLDDYVKDRQFKLFKLHGSTDWVQRATFKGRIQSQEWRSAAEIIGHAPELEQTPNFERHTDRSLPTVLRVPNGQHVQLIPLMPALAVPATGKSRFICPKDHLQSLRDIIPQVRKVLVIGWKAAEQHFLKLLVEGLGETTVKGLIVRGSADGAKETIRSLHDAGIRGDLQADPGGFSDFVIGNRVEAFLSS